MILDPIFNIWLRVLSRLEIAGAAIATVIAQLTASLGFYIQARKRPELFSELHLLKTPDFAHVLHIIKLGLTNGYSKRFLYFYSHDYSRIIAQWSTADCSTESRFANRVYFLDDCRRFPNLQWSAFIGQNYGAKKWDRVSKGYFVGIGIVSIIGIFATVLLIFAARPLFAIFIPEEEAIRHGVVYLRILGVSQLFMCIEIVTAGSLYRAWEKLPPLPS